jgi:hypothetical protein
MLDDNRISVHPLDHVTPSRPGLEPKLIISTSRISTHVGEQRSQLIGKVETSARPDLKQHGEPLDGCVRHVKPGSDETVGHHRLDRHRGRDFSVLHCCYDRIAPFSLRRLGRGRPFWPSARGIQKKRAHRRPDKRYDHHRRIGAVCCPELGEFVQWSWDGRPETGGDHDHSDRLRIGGRSNPARPRRQPEPAGRQRDGRDQFGRGGVAMRGGQLPHCCDACGTARIPRVSSTSDQSARSRRSRS